MRAILSSSASATSRQLSEASLLKRSTAVKQSTDEMIPSANCLHHAPSYGSNCLHQVKVCCCGLFQSSLPVSVEVPSRTTEKGIMAGVAVEPSRQEAEALATSDDAMLCSVQSRNECAFREMISARRGRRPSLAFPAPHSAPHSSRNRCKQPSDAP